MTKLQKILNKDSYPFFIMFGIYLLLFISVDLTGDDAALLHEFQNLTWSDHWHLMLDDYFNWSSRVLVNFVIHFVLGKPIYVFILSNAIVATILSMTFSKLFVRSNFLLNNIFIISLILLFPVHYLGSAGWMITFMTYFWPMTFGFLALVPIAKIENGESFKWYEYIIYSLALIYAGNEEIELVVLLFTYLVYFAYFLFNKKHHIYMAIQLVLSLISLLFTVTTPGNGNRSNTEIINWFPAYNMLDTVDKIDIGFFSTMQNILFDNNLFILIITFILTYVVFKKYSDWLLRAVAVVPFAILMLFGPLKNLVSLFFGQLIMVSNGMTQNGLITISTDSLFSLSKFLLVVVFSVSFIATVLLCLENWFKNLFALSLLSSGVASRVAMGFSPTVYASGFRTGTPLYFGLIAIAILVFADALEKNVLNKKESDIIVAILVFLAAIATLNAGLLIN